MSDDYNAEIPPQDESAAAPSPALTPAVKPSKVDYRNRTYTTDSGYVLKLLPLNYFAVSSHITDQSGKPKIPIVEVEIGLQKRKTKMENPDDPAYKAALRTWEVSKTIRQVRAVFALGIDVSEYQDEIDAWLSQYGSLFPAANSVEQALNWILSIMTQEETMDAMNVIISQALATKEGQELAAETFQGDDQ